MIYEIAISQLVSDGTLGLDDEILVVCGGRFDRDVLAAAGFKNVTISNLDPSHADYVPPYKWSKQNAESLTFDSGSFDVVIVHAGLHHCYSPHRGLIEMMRVARKAALVFEARDSFLLRLAKRIGFTMDYEIEAVAGSADGKSGGAFHSSVPNYIYRWTEREVEKTVRTAEPRYEPSLRFFYHLQLPHERFEKTNRPLLRYALKMLTPALELIGRAFPRQSNEFGFLIEKSRKLHPWLEQAGSDTTLIPGYAAMSGRVYKAAAPDAPRWEPR